MVLYMSSDPLSHNREKKTAVCTKSTGCAVGDVVPETAIHAQQVESYR